MPTPDTLSYAIFGYVVIFGILKAYILRLIVLSRKTNRKLDQNRLNKPIA